MTRLAAVQAAILTARLADNTPNMRDDVECAPDGAANTAGTTCTNSRSTRPTEGGPLPMMMHDTPHENPPAPVDAPGESATIARLQYLLADAIRARETALNEVIALRDKLARADRHWYVDGGNGYCAACALPRANGRHAPRRAVA